MNLQLTQKEKLLLEDQKSHEQMCISKYTEYASQAQEPELKQMFQSIAQQERQHLNTINQILGGQIPPMQSQQGQSSRQSGQSRILSQQGLQSQQGIMQSMKGSMKGSQSMQSGQQGQSPTKSVSYNAKEKDMCSDLLMTEKYVSGTYDTTIFECTDTNVREVLNHIQKEEQQHGEEIFNYMQSKGMYTVH